MPAAERMLRAVLLRFLPGCAAVLVLGLGAIALVAPDHVTAAALLTLVTELAGVTVGFAAVLGLGETRSMGRGLGLRSFEAGVLAPLCAGVCSWLRPDAGLAGIAVLSALAGAVAGLLVMFEGHVVGPRLARAGG